MHGTYIQMYRILVVWDWTYKHWISYHVHFRGRSYVDEIGNLSFSFVISNPWVVLELFNSGCVVLEFLRGESLQLRAQTPWHPYSSGSPPSSSPAVGAQPVAMLPPLNILEFLNYYTKVGIPSGNWEYFIPVCGFKLRPRRRPSGNCALPRCLDLWRRDR